MDEKNGGKMGRGGDGRVDEEGAREGGWLGRIKYVYLISENSSNDDKWNQVKDLGWKIREQCYDAGNIHETN